MNDLVNKVKNRVRTKTGVLSGMKQLAQTKPDIRSRCFFELGQAEQLIKFLLEEQDNIMRPVNRKLAQEWIDTWRTRIHDNNQGGK